MLGCQTYYKQPHHNQLQKSLKSQYQLIFHRQHPHKPNHRLNNETTIVETYLILEDY